MYTLTLKNFKCFTHKTVTFEHIGFILLSAPSGTGKSTLLNGLFYTITGSLKGLSKKKVYASLSFKNDTNTTEDFTIIRNDTKTTLTIGTKKWDASEAQTRIDTLFPYFNSVSYIDQLNLYNFTSLSPADKNEFLRELLLKEFNIEQLEDTVKKNIKDQKDDLSRDTIRIELLEKMITTPVQPNAYLVGETIVSQENVLDLVKTCEENITLFNHRIKQSKDRQSKWKEQQKRREQLSLLHKEKESIESTHDFTQIPILKDITTKYNTLRDHLKRKEMEKILEEKVLIQTNELTRLKETISSRTDLTLLKKALTLKSTLDSLKEDTSEDKNVLTLIQSEEQKLVELCEHIELQTVLVCPECNTHLALDKKILVKRKVSSIVSKDLNDLTREKQELVKKIDKLKSKQNKYELSLSKYNEVMGEYSQLKIHKNTTIDSISMEIKEIEELLARRGVIEQDSYIRELKQTLKKLGSTLGTSTIDESFECSETEYNEKSIQLGILLKAQPRYSSILTQMEELDSKTKDLDLIVIDLESEEEIVRKLETQRDEYNQHTHQLRDWKRVQDEYTKCMAQRNELAQLIQLKNDKLTKYQSHLTFKDLLKKAETVCLEEFVQSLNVHAGMYLEEVFEDPITVELKTSSEQKNGKEKQVLNFQVQYKDMMCSISDLSGGEHDRVHLCYTLALSELLNNRILLIDECFASLDVRTSNTVIEMLREKNITRTSLILCVAHQCVEGVFDSVIKL